MPSRTYFYNAGKLSGKFFIDQISGHGHSVPKKFHKIWKNPYWQIIAEDGTVYDFTKEETVTSSNCGNDQTNTTAWHLSKITSSDQQSEITFTYEPAYYTFLTLVAETKYISKGGDTGCLSNQSCQGTQTFSTHRLGRIDFRNGYVKFNYNTTRCDLVDDKRLDEIQVYTKDNVLLKTFKLGYSYFGGSVPCDRLTEHNKRLKLLSIGEESFDPKLQAMVQNPPYSFFYNEAVTLPSRLSYAQDHWGYFNGKTNNPGLVATFFKILPSGVPVIEKGADRRADPMKAQAGILNKIVYPTGGEMLLSYEGNTVSSGWTEADAHYDYLSLAASNYLVSNLPDPYESATQLTIPQDGATVEFSVSGLDAELWQGCDIVNCYVIKDNNPTPFRELDSFLNGGTEHWPAGVYKLRLETECGVDAIANFSVNVTATIAELQTVYNVGGLRIQQMESRGGYGMPAMIKTFRYHKPDNANESSGILINHPDYGYDLGYFWAYKDGCVTEAQVHTKTCSYVVRTSYSNYPLATSQGGYVGYENVYEDLSTNGETVYTYNVYPDIQSNYPFAPVENFDWRRGFEETRTDYRLQGTETKKTKEIISSPTGGPEFRIYGYKAGCISWEYFNCYYPSSSCSNKVFTYYPVITEFFGTSQTTERNFSSNGTDVAVETIAAYTYSNIHFQTTETRILTSNGTSANTEEMVTYRKYPFDYTFTGTPVGTSGEGIKKLQDLHIGTAPVEEYVLKQKRSPTNELSDQKIVSGTVYEYKPTAPYPDKVYMLEMATPILFQNFFTGSFVSNNQFFKNSSYKLHSELLAYDPKGNIVARRKANDLPSSFIWGYNQSYPIAEVLNSSNTNDIAYTSFEEEGTGNWAYNSASATSAHPFTGRRSYNLTGHPVVKNSLNSSSTYVISFWYLNGASFSVSGGTQTDVQILSAGNGWTRNTRKVSGTSTITISGTGHIDELRLFPAGSQMMTYTYDPLVGMTSATDANEMTTHFDYDSFGRLKAIRDYEGNVLKTHVYHYKEQ